MPKKSQKGTQPVSNFGMRPPQGLVQSQEEGRTAPMTVRQMRNVFGDSGTRRYSGFFFEEYNPEWHDIERIETVEKMRRGDGAVKAVLRAIKAPMLATKWVVKTDADESDEQAEEIRQFVDDNLMKMRRTWKEFLRESLAYLDFGFYCFELIWEKRKDGKIWLADLEPRIPHSIYRWRLNDGRFGIQQILQSDEHATGITEVPANKLLILTNDKEGDDVTGQSVLRAAYKHYVMKDVLYKIQGIKAERFGVGIPIVKLGSATGDQDKKDAADMASSIRSNEKDFIVLPNKDWEIDILVPKTTGHDNTLSEGVTHHNTQIMTSVLADFLSLGSGDTGSYALSEDKSSFFLKFVEDLCTYFVEQMNNQVIRRMVNVNFGVQETYPHLDFTPLGDIDFKEYAETLNVLAQAGLIKVDGKLKEFIHEAFKMPKITDEDKEMMDEQEVEGNLSKLEKKNQPPTDKGDLEDTGEVDNDGKEKEQPE